MNCARGTLAVWNHHPKGGYGYLHVVPCVVMGVGKYKVRIAVRRASNFEIVYRWVRPTSLQDAGTGVNRDMAEMIRSEVMGDNARKKLRLMPERP